MRCGVRWSCTGRISSDPLEVLRRLGGRELAAMAGAVLAARLQRIPVIIDGYVATAAAAVLKAMRPDALDHCLAGHLSAEPAHRRLLERLEMKPLLDLGMRLGEGSGAAMAAGIVKAAADLHNGMATFESGGGQQQGGVSMGPAMTSWPAGRGPAASAPSSREAAAACAAPGAAGERHGAGPDRRAGAGRARACLGQALHRSVRASGSGVAGGGRGGLLRPATASPSCPWVSAFRA